MLSTHIIVPLGHWQGVSDGQPIPVNLKIRRSTVGYEMMHELNFHEAH